MSTRIYNTNPIFYVYLWYYENKVFYVGKGCKNRAYKFSGRDDRNYKLKKKFNEIRSTDKTLKEAITIRFPRKNLREYIALELEMLLIDDIGLENLCNLTRGGDGCCPSDDTRDKLRTPKSEQAKENMRLGALKRPPVTDDTRNNMRIAALKKPPITDNTRNNMSIGQKKRSNQDRSEQAKENMRIAALKKPPITDNTRNNMSIAQSKIDWIFTSPTGEIFIQKNMHQFCKDHGLNRGCMGQVANGKKKHHKGWKCEKII